MALKLRPRNETEFRNEIREGLMAAFPGKCTFHITHSFSGEPDSLISIAGLRFRAEFKYSAKAFDKFRSLEEVWNMLRGIQQITIQNMAMSGELVYVVVCCGGIEAPWFRADRSRIVQASNGNAPIASCLVLERLSRRLKNGRWTSGLDWGDDMPEKKSLAEHLLTLPKHLTRKK